MELIHSETIAQMTLEEKARMMSGKNTWETVDNAKYGIESLFLSDGPCGLRKQAGKGDHLGLNGSIPATSFPTTATVANSWDEELGRLVGQALGEEAKALGVDILLGPGLNIKRSPLCGRNFEYFSEDPYLSGKMAAAYIQGIQKNGVSACPKHLACNSQELRRMAMNAVVDERTLREIYLTGFEIAVKEGKPKAIMSAYNEINGVYANENPQLLQEILVNEWGFDGIVVSDWGGSNDHALGVKYGSHLEMPGTGNAGMRDIVRAVETGELEEAILDKRVDELLNTIHEIKKQKGIGNGWFDREAHHQIARKAAEESIVLLKNEGKILPLKKGLKAAVIGDFAENPRYQGAGSSLVNPTKKPEAITEVMTENAFDEVVFARGYRRNKPADARLEETAVEAAQKADIALIFAGLDEVSETEGRDRNHMRMPEAQNRLITAVAQTGVQVVVILSAGSVVEMPWIHEVDAVVHGYLGGQAGASAMMNVLTGKVCPSGKLNETYPVSYEGTPAYHYYPSKERNSEYREGLYVGYRYYDTVKKEVLFPFGFGLSYTVFQYSNLFITEKGVSFDLKNTGAVDGAEVAQLYIGKKSDTVFGPEKELKGFRKVFLKAGEEKRVEILFDEMSFRFFDTASHAWQSEAGQYDIFVGASVEDIRLSGNIERKGSVSAGNYDKNRLPHYFSGKITNISEDEYQALYEKEIPDGSWGGEIGINDAVCQLYYGKGILGRIFCGVLKVMIKISDSRGKPSLNALFNYNMPIRGYAKMTGGFVTMDMARALTEMANGHRIKGTAHLIRATVKRSK